MATVIFLSDDATEDELKDAAQEARELAEEKRTS